MTNIEKKQSEIEKALNSALDIYKSSLEAILGVSKLQLEIEITGVKLSTLAVIVEESDNLELWAYGNCGIDKNETHNHVRIGEVTLTNIKIND